MGTQAGTQPGDIRQRGLEVAGRPVRLLEGFLYLVPVAVPSLLLAGYLIDLAGLPLGWPQLLLPSLALTALVGLLAWRRGVSLEVRVPQLVGGLGVAGVLLLYALRRAWPSLYPVSGSADTVHHYLLADYIVRHHSLVRGLSEAANLQEMAVYPFGSLLPVALASWLTGLPAIVLLHPLASACVALIGLYVYCILWDLLPDNALRMPLAALGGLLLFLPRRYVFGQFVDDFFLTQVFGQVWLVAWLYWLTRLARDWRRSHLVPMVGAGIGLTFSYPTWLPALGLAFGVVLLLDKQASVRSRIWTGTLVAVPLALVVGAYLHDRLQAGLGIMQNNGVAADPSLSVISLPLAVLAPIGLVIALRRRVCLPLVALCLAFAAQYAVTSAAAEVGLTSFYAAKKLWYELALFLVALAGLAVASGANLLADTLARRIPLVALALRGEGGPSSLAGPILLLRRYSSPLLLSLLLVAAVVSPRVAFANQQSHPPMGPDLYAVSTWAQRSFADSSFAYVTPNGYVAYWLEVGIMKRDRGTGSRAMELLDGQPQTTVAAWLADPSQPDLAIVESLSEPPPAGVSALYQRGSAAVLRRPASH